MAIGMLNTVARRREPGHRALAGIRIKPDIAIGIRPSGRTAGCFDGEHSRARQRQITEMDKSVAEYWHIGAMTMRFRRQAIAFRRARKAWFRS